MPSEKTLVSLLLAAVVAGTAAYLPFATSGTRLPPAASAPARPRQAVSGAPSSRAAAPTLEQLQQIAQTHSDAVSLIAEHFGVHAPTDPMWRIDGNPDVPPGTSDLDRLQTVKKLVPPAARVEFVIATLPDAIDSNSRWQFDPMYDSIQRAAAASGYVLDRFYIPDWDVTRNPDEDTPAASRLHERLPGVVLFRRAGDGSPQLLVVFLVFETPIGGVHQLAFRRAVWTMMRWPSSNEVRVIGPTFSGSVPSLARAMRAARDELGIPDLYYRVVSGSATVPGIGMALRQTAGDPVSYASTVLTDDELLGALRRFLTPRIDRGRIAALVEGNTAYGGALRNDLLRSGKLCEGGCPALPFPLHVSRLRSAAIAAGLSQPAPGVDLRPSVPLSLGDPVLPRDQVPPMAPRLASSSADAALAAILSTVEREEIAAIGLFATDARDKLFLAQQIALRSPDTLLFTIEGDLLLAHPDYRRYTDGMIVASSYPLLNATQTWQPTAVPGGNRQQFVSTNAQGIYNAALALLNYTENGAAAAGSLSPPPPLLDYRRDGEGRRGPFAWISVVGRDGIWPLQRDEARCEAQSINCNDDATYVHPFSAAGGRPATSAEVPFRIAPGLLLFFIGIQGFILLHLRWWADRGAERATAWLRPVGAADLASRRPQRRKCIVLATACCLALLLVELAVLLALRGYTQLLAAYTEDRVGSAVEVVAAALAGMLAVATCTLASQPKRLRDVALMTGGGVLGLVVIGERVVPILARATLGNDPLILLNRGLQPLTGASPFVPVLLFLIALYLWLGVQVARVATPTLTARLSQSSDAASLGPLAIGNFATLAGNAQSAIQGWFGMSRMHLGVVTVAVAAILVFVMVQGVETAERSAFDLVFVGGWVVLQGAMCVTLAQQHCFWRATKDLLKGLAVHPMADAFGRVPRELFLNRMPPKGPRLIHLQHAVNAQTLVMSGLWALIRSGQPAAVLDIRSMAVEERRRWEQAAVGLTPPDMLPASEAEMGALQAALELRSKLDGDLASDNHPHIADSNTWTALVDGTHRLLPMVERFWRRRTPHVGALTLPPAREGRPPDPSTGSADRDPYVKWFHDAEVLLAVPIALMLRELMARAVRGLYVIFAGVVLLVLYHASFPVYPQRSTLAVTWLYIAAAAGAVIGMVVSAERDAVLSRLAGTPPGRIQWDSAFLSRTALPLLLAMLTLFATQFPETGGAVLRWLRPVQTALP